MTLTTVLRIGSVRPVEQQLPLEERPFVQLQHVVPINSCLVCVT